MIASPIEDLFLSRLAVEDDPAFWTAMLDAVVGDVEALDVAGRKADDVVIQVGACSHWSHPHWVRWKVAGGFASCDGYQGAGAFGFGLPKFDWSILLRREASSGAWVAVERVASKRPRFLRVAIPTRTRRHDQAVVTALWVSGPPASPGHKLERRYGFRKLSGEWCPVVVEEYPRERSTAMTGGRVRSRGERS